MINRAEKNEIIIFVTIIMCCAILGMIFGKISSEKNVGNNFIYFLFMLIVKILFISLSSLLVHEVGHCFMFILRGYKIRLVLIGPFIYISEKNKKIKFRITSHSLGGIVIPKLKSTINDETLILAVNDMKLVLLAGPLFTIGLLICTIINSIVVNRLSDIHIILIWINSLILIFSMIKTLDLPGDVYAYINLSTDKKYAIPFLYNYSKFEKISNNYLSERMNLYVEDIVDKKISNLNKLRLINLILDRYLITTQQIPDYIKNFIIGQMKEKSSVVKSNYIYKSIFYIIIHKIIYFEKLINKNSKVAKEYYNFLLNDKYTIKSQVLEYYKFRTEYILGISTNIDFINYIKPDSLYSVFNELEQYCFNEKIINERIFISNHYK